MVPETLDSTWGRDSPLREPLLDAPAPAESLFSLRGLSFRFEAEFT